MSIEMIQTIGLYIVVPICIAIVLAVMMWAAKE